MSHRRIDICPICKNQGLEFFRFGQSFDKLGVKPPIKKCLNCSHIFTALVPTVETIRKRYNDYQYFIDIHSKSKNLAAHSSFLDYIEGKMRYLNLFYSVYTEMNICEVGCLEGKVLEQLKLLGANDVLGVDINARLIELMNDHAGIPIVLAFFDTLKTFLEGHFDLNFSAHTLEHVIDVENFLRLQIRSIKPDGAVLNIVPSNDGEYENKDHFHFFTKQSLIKQAKLAGFRRIFVISKWGII